MRRHSWPWLLLESLENARIPFYRASLPCCSMKPPLGELTRLVQPHGASRVIFFSCSCKTIAVQPLLLTGEAAQTSLGQKSHIFWL